MQQPHRGVREIGRAHGPLGQEVHQSAFLEFATDNPFRLHDQSLPSEGALFQRQRIRSAQHDPSPHLAPCAGRPASKPPDVVESGHLQHQDRMARDIFRTPGSTMAFDIRGACTQARLQGRERRRHPVSILQRPERERNFHPVRSERRWAIMESQIHRDARIPRLKMGQPRNEIEQPKRDGRRHPQFTGGFPVGQLRDALVCGLQPLKEGRDLRMIEAPGFRRDQSTRAALEQRRSEFGLEHLNHSRNPGRVEAVNSRSRRQTSGAENSRKDLEVVRVHSCVRCNGVVPDESYPVGSHGSIFFAMKPLHLLRIDCSTRIAGSHSRGLADSFLAHVRRHRPDVEVTLRDLDVLPVQHLDGATIAGFYGGESSPGLELSERLIAEVLWADVIVLSLPIYNFGVPSVVKAWIDHVVRKDRTFAVNASTGSFVGLLGARRVVVCAAYGVDGYLTGNLQSLDFLRPYLTAVFGFIGVTDITVLAVEGTATSPTAQAASLARAQTVINAWPVTSAR